MTHHQQQLLTIDDDELSFTGSSTQKGDAVPETRIMDYGFFFNNNNNNR